MGRNTQFYYAPDGRKNQTTQYGKAVVENVRTRLQNTANVYQGVKERFVEVQKAPVQYGHQFSRSTAIGRNSTMTRPMDHTSTNKQKSSIAQHQPKSLYLQRT